MTDVSKKAGPRMQQLIDAAKQTGHCNIVLISPDAVALYAVKHAMTEGIIDKVFLVGDAQRITRLVTNGGCQKSRYDIIPVPPSDTFERDATFAGIAIVKAGQAHMMMKGKINTATFLKGVMDKDRGISTSRRLSLVCLFEIPGIDRLVIMTDPGINPRLFSGDNDQSGLDIIYNAVDVAKSVGIAQPKVALIGANEVVSDAVPSSVLFDALSKRPWEECDVFGPLSYDIALYEKYAIKKGMHDNPVAGKADVLIVPDIVSGNVIYKSWITTARASVANVVPGADVPLIISSRSDTDLSKFLTICSSALYAGYIR